jgi:hypothetical protein
MVRYSCKVTIKGLILKSKKMKPYCDICWILLPSESHRGAHYSSEKHKSNYDFKNNTLSESNALICEICCITANTKTQLVSHMTSKSHSKKLTDRDFINEKLMKNTEEEEEQQQQHEVKFTLSDDDDELIPQTLPNQQPSSNKSSIIYSSNESLSSTSSSIEPEPVLDQSTSSSIEPEPVLEKSKQTKLKLKEVSPLSWCAICYVRYSSSQNRDQHVNGHAHKKREEASVKYMDLVEVGNYCKLCYTKTNDKSQLERHLKSENHERAIKQYVEFYNLLKANDDSGINMPFTVDEKGNLVDSSGSGDVLTKILVAPVTVVNIVEEKKNKSSDNNNDNMNDIEVIRYDCEKSLLNGVEVMDSLKLDPKWDNVLSLFENLKKSIGLIQI